MRDLMKSIFDTSRYASLVEKNHAQMVYGISAFLVFFVTFFFTISSNPVTGGNYWQRMSTNPAFAFSVPAFYVLALISITFTRLGYANLGSVTLLFMGAFGFGPSVIQEGLYIISDGFILAIIVLAGGLLLKNAGLALGFVISLIIFILGLSQRSTVPPPSVTDNAGQLFDITSSLLLIVALIYLFLRYSRLNRAEGIQEAIRDRLKIADITTNINQMVAQRVPLNALLEDIVTHVKDEFPEIYHAQVFLTDPSGQIARLAASTGTVGKQLIARGHNLGVGSLSVIGQVTFKSAPIVSEAGSIGTVHHHNELLPETRFEAAFPLQIGDRTIGALDLQTKEDNAFPSLTVEAFASLANRIALAIDNVRQFERAEARIKENQQLVEQTRRALREVERLNERLTARAWSEFLRRQRTIHGLNVDFGRNNLQEDDEWTASMIEAVKLNHLIQEHENGRQIISLPLHVRGQVVGAMEFELDEDYTFSPENLSLVQEITERFGLAAENTRLLEESQRIAQREALVNEIGSRLQTADSVEATLTEAVQGLRDALNANRVAIRLGRPPESGSE